MKKTIIAVAITAVMLAAIFTFTDWAVRSPIETGDHV